MSAPTISVDAQAQAIGWAALAKTAGSYATLQAYAVGWLLELLPHPDLTPTDRHYLADLIDRDLNGWTS